MQGCAKKTNKHKLYWRFEEAVHNSGASLVDQKRDSAAPLIVTDDVFDRFHAHVHAHDTKQLENNAPFRKYFLV